MTPSVGCRTGRFLSSAGLASFALCPGCRSRSQVAAHEILHTMGYWHPTSAYAPLTINRGSTGSDWSAEMRYHAAVMYSRPPGNRDPDTDPPIFCFATSGAAGPPVVSCELRAPCE